jgi:hypothetical protein
VVPPRPAGMPELPVRAAPRPDEQRNARLDAAGRPSHAAPRRATRDTSAGL